VDVVIPTRDRLDLLRACIASIEQRCGNFAVTITIVDNDSREDDTLAYLAHTPHRVVRHPGPFNYAEIVNRGVAAGHHDVVVVVNNDTIVTDGWLDALVPLATLSDVGVVGATLVSPQGSVQHAGMAAVPYPVELPYGSVRDLRTHDEVQLSRPQSAAIRNVLAVTGACHVIERSKWDRVGGMDEALAVVGNDVDLCLRLAERGHFTVLQPNVTITHVGKASRGGTEPIDDHVRFLARWPFLTELRDPYVPRRRRFVTS
jgi:GT2 family glycosyltransferase